MNPLRIAVPIIGPLMDDALRDMDRAVNLEVDMIELRIDCITDPNLERLLEHSKIPKIATNRVKYEGGKFEGSEEQRVALLQNAINLGVEYVDIELDYYFQHFSFPSDESAKLIVSHHNFEGAPKYLEDIYRMSTRKDADIIKIAACANSFADVIKMMELVFYAGRTIGLNMDKKDNLKYVTKQEICNFQEMFRDMIDVPGRFWDNLGNWTESGVTYSGFSRVISPVLGSYLTFACLPGKPSAPGQLTVEELRESWKKLQIE